VVPKTMIYYALTSVNVNAILSALRSIVELACLVATSLNQISVWTSAIVEYPIHTLAQGVILGVKNQIFDSLIFKKKESESCADLEPLS